MEETNGLLYYSLTFLLLRMSYAAVDAGCSHSAAIVTVDPADSRLEWAPKPGSDGSGLAARAGGAIDAVVWSLVRVGEEAEWVASDVVRDAGGLLESSVGRCFSVFLTSF
jgi:hypothetical protein